MDLRLNEDQEMIRSAVRGFLEGECTSSLIRDLEASAQGYSQDLWRSMAELGFMGVAFSEECGGLGLGFQELCLVVEELGRFRLSGPFVWTAALCGQAVDRFGSGESRSRTMARIAGGEMIMTCGLFEPGASWDVHAVDTKASEERGQYVLTGSKTFVPYAEAAEEILVLARTGGKEGKGLTAFLVPTGAPELKTERLDTLGPEHHYRVDLDGVRVPGESILGEKGDGEWVARSLFQWGAAAKCAEMVGGAQRVLEMSVDYARERVQFGSPIGSFQAVQHHCANMAVDVESSRFITYEAVWRLDEGIEADVEVSTAKAWTSDAYQRVCAAGHGIHGAVGFTKEHDMQLYSRHAKEAELAFGDGDWHRDRVADGIGL